VDLYFSPLACSMASRIALYEADASARFIEVDPKSKRMLDGGFTLESGASSAREAAASH
jgi:hypothetical protein